ncbi:hypothetical protein Q3G72_035234 [Acer saccharum]|nr:hypothetical protein Q3G72_035234 [Acer saccharum]
MPAAYRAVRRPRESCLPRRGRRLDHRRGPHRGRQEGPGGDRRPDRLLVRRRRRARRGGREQGRDGAVEQRRRGRRGAAVRALESGQRQGGGGVDPTPAGRGRPVRECGMSLVPTWPFVVGTLAIGLVAGAFGTHAWDERKYDKLVAQQASALAQANAANLKKQDELQAAVDEAEMKRGMDNAQHTKDLEAARSDVRAGRERLSIRGACSAQPNAQARTTPGPVAEERTDLLPGTADDLVRIAGAAAKDVRDFNDLLDRYNAVCK